MTRRIFYVSGTRADFGLMESTLLAIHGTPGLEVGIVVTGMHLDDRYGMTVRDIEAAGLPIVARVPVQGGPTGAGMAQNVGAMITAFTEVLTVDRPDILLLLGDRGEMLAGAIVALHLAVPVVHIHGGERSGTVDEPIRHAISKLSHFHLVATEESRQRLVRMGETGEHVVVVGAPGLDALRGAVVEPLSSLACRLGISDDRPFALVVYHPIHDEAERGALVVGAIVDALLAKHLQVVALVPNSDAGSEPIRMELERRQARGQVHLFKHLARADYISALATAAVLVGNSSSGIIEAASFGTPVVNVGRRQNMRQRNANTIDVESETDIADGLSAAVALPHGDGANVYGDGHAGRRIADFLAGLNLASPTRLKTNAY